MDEKTNLSQLYEIKESLPGLKQKAVKNMITAGKTLDMAKENYEESKKSLDKYDNLEKKVNNFIKEKNKDIGKN